MNSVNLIKTIRNYLANDVTLIGNTCLDREDATDALNVILYGDSNFASKKDFHKWPIITLRLDDDESHLRNSDSNTILLTITIHNPTAYEGAVIRNNNIKDRLKLMLRDKHEPINSQAVSLGLDLKVRDCHWVGAITYEEKEFGSERLHKIICDVKLILGD